MLEIQSVNIKERRNHAFGLLEIHRTKEIKTIPNICYIEEEIQYIIQGTLIGK